MAVFGLDIGTSSCKASCADGNSFQIITVSDGFNNYWGNEKLLISAAYLDGQNDDVLLVGQEAYNEHLLHPQWYLQEFKRKFAHKGPVIFTQNSQATIDDVYVTMLSKMNEIFIRTDIPVDKLVLTHPASYSEALVNRLIEDAKKAGFDDVSTIDEPSAAAECYARTHNVSVGENVLVYDFGGGTFDTALIRLDPGGFRHLTGSLGLSDCGGADIDSLIFSDIKKKILADASLDGEKVLKIPSVISFLNEKAVSIKHKLSQQKNVSETILVGYIPFVYRLSRDELDSMMSSIIVRTVELCKRIVDNANLKPQNIQRVLLVGGSSRIPLIISMLKKCFPAANVSEEDKLEYLVCSGAAISNCTSETEMLLIKANRGDPEAVTEVAVHCLLGDEESIPQDTDKGISMLHDAVRKECGQACAVLGKILHDGLFEQKQDLDAAAVLFQKAVKLSDSVESSVYDLLGDYYLENNKTDEAIACYLKAVDMGDANSQLTLGRIYLQEGKAKEGIMLWEKAAAQNHPVAQYNLGAVYERGNDIIPADQKKSFDYYLASAQNDDRDAQYKVGMRYYLGKPPVNEDNNEAFKWFSKAVEQENENAYYVFAECYEKGFGTTININEAFKYYTKAAEEGIIGAIEKMAVWYYGGKEPVVSIDYKKAFDYAEAAAESGSDMSTYILALCYDNGNGVKASRSKALEYYRKAADAGIIDAINDLAFIYYEGTHNVAKDYSKAFELAQKAADNGQVNSMALVGACYDDGLGISQNKKEALKWYKKAAECGHVISMRLAGIILHNGEGNVSENRTEAEKLFRMAAANGDENSIEILRVHYAPKPDLAAPRIQFRRNANFCGSARDYYVRIDMNNTTVKKLKNGTSFDYTLTSGSHRIEVTNGPAFGFGAIDWSTSNCLLDSTFDFDPGDILLVDVSIAGGEIRWIQVAGVQQ